MLLLGNILALAGCAIMVAVGFIRKKERVLLVQCGQLAFMGASNLALGGISGAISNLLGIARNLIFAKTKGSWWLKAIFIAVQIAFTAMNWNGRMVEVLPIVATVIFVWFLDTKSDVTFKFVNIAAMVMWLIYDWNYRNYVAFTADILTIASNCVAVAGLMKS